MRDRRWLVLMVCMAFALVSGWRCHATEPPTTYSVGVAQLDITPDYPVRLSGFGFRRTESEGVTLPIWAKALAISTSSEGAEPAVLITIDNLGIPASMCDDVAKRLAAKVGLKRERLAITATHTHTAPMVRGVAPTLFGQPIPEDHWQRIDQYTRELTDKLEQVALAALKDRKPSRLTWGVGTAKFAINRRTKGGPVDHDLPVLVVKSLDGTVRAIYVSYACHCVTLSNNKISGDWAGYAQDLIQRDFPSAVALCSVGCGADSNPSSGVTGEKTDVALQQGAEIAAEVKRLLNGFLAPVTGDLATAWKTITLDFTEPPTPEQWEEKAKLTNAIGYHARVQLERLARGEALQSKLDYPIASWSFGDSLAMVFLPGEVVVDYSLRLKKELDGRRLWINAYANDEPCYIPSERVLKEGGYEGGGAMVYYDRPGPLKAGLEQQIVDVVKEQLATKFAAPFDASKTQSSRPLSPQQSLAALQTTPNLRVDLVVAEPLVTSPVAVDFGHNGELWVCEMYDYPLGLSGNYEPGGRIRLVRDTDGDGQFDASTIFLDKIPFPTGVTVWRKGVLVCAAPDILYAEDTNGDDKADVVKNVFTGFGVGNFQARVNSLVPGLDGWMYGSCGLFGGTITNFKGEQYELGDRDFRFKPDTGEIEAATGRTQQGRVRDDFGNWFGCDNSNLAYHYPLAEHYLRRNPYISSPPARVNIVQTDDARNLFPARADAQRFKLSGPGGNITAACGLGVYCDTLLGDDYFGNLFTCEPVNLLVHRLKLTPQGSSFIAERPANEADTEFLRSTDGWFRPVQAVTGPDGGLWIVDMYRFVIEHPRWIPAEDLAQLDVRAGSSLGRIYRVMPHQQKVETEVDQIARLRHLEKKRGDVADPTKMIRKTPLKMGDFEGLLASVDSRLRRKGIALLESVPSRLDGLSRMLQMLDDSGPHVRLQLACSLGEWDDPRVGPALAKMALKDADDPYLVAAIFSSVNAKNLQAFTKQMFDQLVGREPPSSLMAPFLATAVGYGDDVSIKLALTAVAKRRDGDPQPWQLHAVANLVESLQRQKAKSRTTDVEVQATVRQMQDDARLLAKSASVAEATRLAAINLVGRDASRRAVDIELLGELLSPQHSPAIQTAAVTALGRIGDNTVPEKLTATWNSLSPAVQMRVVDVLISREVWQRHLLEQIGEGRITASSIDAGRRQRLVTHEKPAIRELAVSVLGERANADRQKVVQQYRDALASLKGDAERGRAVFTKSCAQCHKLRDVGHAVGPDLAMLVNKTPSFLLQELLDPNRNVDSRYTSYIAVTKDGLTLTGLLASESASSLTLLAAEGKQQTLHRADLDELKATAKSLMPEGLEKDLSPQTIADVIAFLGTSPAPPKKFDGNMPSIIKPVDGRLALLAAKAAIYGDQIVFEQPFQNIGYWHGVQDHVVWTIELSTAGEFDVHLDYACDPGSAGNKFLIEAGTRSLHGHIESTGGWDKYKQSNLGTILLSAGSPQIVMRPDGNSIRGALADVRGLHLVPRGQAFALATPTATASAVEPADVAKLILDEKLPQDKRQSLIAQHPTKAAELVAAMTSDLPAEAKEEYRRIPWVWRVSIACGRRNEPDEIRKLLDVALPEPSEPLRDWQAVVIGGGIINGISLERAWPRPRLEEIMKNNAALKARWRTSLSQAAAMVDNEQTPTGTRYDALRMIALDDWSLRREQLAKYLAKDVHAELQMGAISGLSDVESSDVSKLLLDGLGHFSVRNRDLAIEALLRTESRAMALLAALNQRKIEASWLNESHRKRLQESVGAASQK